MRGGLLFGLGLLLLLSLAPPVPAAEAEENAVARSCIRADPAAPPWAAVCIRQDHYFRDTCSAIQLFAWRERLPSGYFARLIWQESRFDPHALSVAGAQGIAQFIPSTARVRALRNPFDPAEALAKSAEYLRFLTDKFGNLGLAAVAYNGGEARAARFVTAAGLLPAETRYYVETITGQTPDYWLSSTLTSTYALSNTDTFIDACVKLAEGEIVPRMDRPPSEWMPWGVMLAQNFSQATAIRRFERVQAAYPTVLAGEKLMILMARNPNFGPRLRHYAMIGRNSREDAEALCVKLQAVGASCVVRKN
ncbi:lytic transglycosylase domain-containing protein [Devosia sp. CN2-171]|uniref:lytic transglycosylase domain-containing protein n=1 Tax=Devosia sp. CN2-171 TaxID=3400909 RepID=UPI003BF784E0